MLFEPAAGERLRNKPRFKRLECSLTPEVHIRSNVNEITLKAVIFNSAKGVLCIKKFYPNLSKATY